MFRVRSTGGQTNISTFSTTVKLRNHKIDQLTLQSCFVRVKISVELAFWLTVVRKVFPGSTKSISVQKRKSRLTEIYFFFFLISGNMAESCTRKQLWRSSSRTKWVRATRPLQGSQPQGL